MFSKLNLYIVALCAFLMTVPIGAQPVQDSTDLPKMQEGDFKAIKPTESVSTLTKANIKEIFKGLQATVDNSGDYSAYHEDLQYKVIEHSGNLAIQKYTPRVTCSKYLNPQGMAMCSADNKALAGKTSVACVIPKGTKSCKSSKGGYYELTLSGLIVAESYVRCSYVPISPGAQRLYCGYEPYPQKVYIWNAPVVAR